MYSDPAGNGDTWVLFAEGAPAVHHDVGAVVLQGSDVLVMQRKFGENVTGSCWAVIEIPHTNLIGYFNIMDLSGSTSDL